MIVEERSGRRTVVIVALLLMVAVIVLLLLLGGGSSRRIVHRPGPNHTIVKNAPKAGPAVVAATNRGEAGAIAAAHQYAESFPTGRHAYGYRVLSFHGRKALVEFVAPENIAGSVRWWIFDAPTVYGSHGWSVNAPWMTLDQAGSPPPPLTDYQQWPSG